MDIWIGTTNKGKLSEMRPLLEKAVPGIVIHSLDELPHYSQPPENGKTFLDNARIKARSVKAMKPGTWVVAEDSGLEVEALGGLPGVHSARYAGPHARDSENVAKLLKMLQLKAATTRNAKFLCTMVVFDPQGAEHIFTGELLGTIGRNPVGQMGFGYDPVFVPVGETKTMAELGPAFKNKNSHRAQATHSFIEKLLQLAT
jgi:XTP/dITP diphosphohydrolase